MYTVLNVLSPGSSARRHGFAAFILRICIVARCESFGTLGYVSDIGSDGRDTLAAQTCIHGLGITYA